MPLHPAGSKGGGAVPGGNPSTDLFQVGSFYADDVGDISAVKGLPVLKDVIINMCVFQPFDIGILLLLILQNDCFFPAEQTHTLNPPYTAYAVHLVLGQYKETQERRLPIF